MNKNLLKNFTWIPIIFSVSMVGCSGTSSSMSVPQPQVAPMQRVLTPQKSDGMNYYATGIGATLEEAKADALNQIASEISVTVSSSMEVSKKSINGAYSKDLDSKVKTTVEGIKFTSATVSKSEVVNGQHYVVMKVNRNVLFNAKKLEFDKTLNELTTLEADISKNGIFELLKRDASFASNVELANTQIPILKAINGSFDEVANQKIVFDLQSKLKAKKSEVVVVVTSDNALEYANVMKKYIASSGMKVSNSAAKGENAIFINMSKNASQKTVKTTSAQLKDAKFADVEISITTTNGDKKIVAQNKIKVTNVSNTSYEDAIKNTSKFDNLIKESSLISVLMGQE